MAITMSQRDNRSASERAAAERSAADKAAAERAAAERAARRAFIRAQHPDAGGDPDRFVAGLARFDADVDEPARSPGPALRVHRSRRPDRVLRRSIRNLTRRLSGTPPRNLR